jgi:hypothetical protein
MEKEKYVVPNTQIIEAKIAQMIAGSVLKENTVDIDNWQKTDDDSDDDVWQ